MWELDYKESWVLKNWCFWTEVLEKTLESPLGCKEIQPAHPKGNQSWVFIGRTDVEAETPIVWPCDERSWLIGKDPDAGEKNEGRRRRGWQRMRWLDGITHSMDKSLSKFLSWWWTGRLGMLQSMGSQIDTTERLNWFYILPYRLRISGIFPSMLYGIWLLYSCTSVRPHLNINHILRQEVDPTRKQNATLFP